MDERTDGWISVDIQIRIRGLLITKHENSAVHTAVVGVVAAVNYADVLVVIFSGVV